MPVIRCAKQNSNIWNRLIGLHIHVKQWLSLLDFYFFLQCVLRCRFIVLFSFIFSSFLEFFFSTKINNYSESLKLKVKTNMKKKTKVVIQIQRKKGEITACNIYSFLPLLILCKFFKMPEKI